MFHFFKKSKNNILKEIYEIRLSSDYSKAKYLVNLIFKYNDRVITASVIQTLLKINSENENNKILIPNYFINPKKSTNFSFFVFDVFGIKDKGTCVSGIVSSGTLGFGNKLILNKADGRNINTSCDDIHFFDKKDDIIPGDNIGIFLNNISMGEVSQGDIIYSK